MPNVRLQAAALHLLFFHLSTAEKHQPKTGFSSIQAPTAFNPQFNQSVQFFPQPYQVHDVTESQDFQKVGSFVMQRRHFGDKFGDEMASHRNIPSMRPTVSPMKPINPSLHPSSPTSDPQPIRIQPVGRNALIGSLRLDSFRIHDIENSSQLEGFKQLPVSSKPPSFAPLKISTTAPTPIQHQPPTTDDNDQRIPVKLLSNWKHQLLQKQPISFAYRDVAASPLGSAKEFLLTDFHETKLPLQQSEMELLVHLNTNAPITAQSAALQPLLSQQSLTIQHQPYVVDDTDHERRLIDIDYHNNNNNRYNEEQETDDQQSLFRLRSSGGVPFTLAAPVFRNEAAELHAARDLAMKQQQTAQTKTETTETVPVEIVGNADCSTPTVSLCNQEAWADFGVALSGLLTKRELCEKYLPPTSCVSKALASCAMKIETVTRHMLTAFGKVAVYWCSNPPVVTALDSMSSCFSSAVLGGAIFDGCISQSVQFPKSIVRSFLQTNKDAKNQILPGGFSLFSMLNTLVGGFQGNTLSCLYDSISKECGIDAAQLALGPAFEEIEMTRPKKEQKTLAPDVATTQRHPVLDRNQTRFNMSRRDSFKQTAKTSSASKTVSDNRFLLILSYMTATLFMLSYTMCTSAYV